METSRLQTAANDLRTLQDAIAQYENELVAEEAKAEVKRQLMEDASANYREALRAVADTRSYLRAQREKLSRELDEMRELTYRVESQHKKQLNVINCASEGIIRPNY